MNPNLSGIFAAAVTPLTSDDSSDVEAIPGLLAFLAGRGCHGVLLLGTTGEGPSFSSTERLHILQAGIRVRESLPGLKLLAGTGTPSLSESIVLTKAAFDLGYDAAVVLPPYYYRKAGEAGLFAWFRELIQRAVPADGALLGYHIPGMTGIGFSLDLLARLIDAFPRKFAGIKDSSHDPEWACSLGEHFAEDLLVLTGTDSYLKLAMENHASGCITAPANLISPDLRCIWEGMKNGEDVTLLQENVTMVRQMLEKYSPFPPLLKALLAELHGFPLWRVRAPLEESPRSLIDAILEEAHFA